MSENVNRLNAKLLRAERQRDELVRENLRLRDFLLARAKECEACGGTGCVTVTVTLYDEAVNDFVEDRQEPCGDCLDIREVLEC
jgi:hypothetical protein